MIAQHFISEGFPARTVLGVVGLSSSVYYYRSSNGKHGREPSMITWTKQGIAVGNEQVVQDIIGMLGEEFVDYGYHKTTHWLRQERGYIIS